MSYKSNIFAMLMKLMDGKGRGREQASEADIQVERSVQVGRRSFFLNNILRWYLVEPFL